MNSTPTLRLMPATTKTPEIASASLPDTLVALQVNPETGLTHGEIDARRKEYGYNEVAEQKAHPVLKFLGKFWGLSAWMLELIMLLSLLLRHYSDLAIVGALLVVNAVLGFAQERRAAGVMETLRRRLQVNARVLRDASWQVVPARELVPGDIVRVRPGDIVPADVKVLTGTLSIDQSALTGESKDADKATGDVLSAGSLVRRGEGNGVVMLTGGQTYFGRTTQLVQIARPKLHIEAVVSKVVRWLFVIVGALLSVVIVLTLIRGAPLFEMIPLMLVLLMSAVPARTVSTPHSWRTMGKAGWAKVRLILSAMQMGFQRIIWLDADAVIVDPAIDLGRLTPDGIGMTRHPNSDRCSAHWNSGVMLVTRCERTQRFFENVDSEPENDSPWMEQLAINTLAAQDEWAPLLFPLAPAFNSTPGAVMAQAPVILAGHGLALPDRKKLIGQWVMMARRRSDSNGTAEELTCRDQFADFLNRERLVGEAAEIGVLQGEFSKKLLDRWNGRLLHLVDPWRHLEDYDDINNPSDADHLANMNAMLDRLSTHDGRFRVHRELSHTAAPSFAERSLDFVYIDANHGYSSVMHDLRAWFPKVRPAGVLAGHDYLDGILPEGNFGVKRAVDEFARELGLRVHATHEPGWPSWYVVKK
jgi:hypothetical protein